MTLLLSNGGFTPVPEPVLNGRPAPDHATALPAAPPAQTRRRRSTWRLHHHKRGFRQNL